jgi:hypothetical protein
MSKASFPASSSKIPLAPHVTEIQRVDTIDFFRISTKKEPKKSDDHQENSKKNLPQQNQDLPFFTQFCFGQVSEPLPAW